MGLTLYHESAFEGVHVQMGFGQQLLELGVLGLQFPQPLSLGSLHAADARMAIENARDVYTRRMEGVSIWVVESRHIHASQPEEAGAFYDPASDKPYRHPTFYDLPDEVDHM